MTKGMVRRGSNRRHSDGGRAARRGALAAAAAAIYTNTNSANSSSSSTALGADANTNVNANAERQRQLRESKGGNDKESGLTVKSPQKKRPRNIPSRLHAHTYRRYCSPSGRSSERIEHYKLTWFEFELERRFGSCQG
ncbi:GL15369 [Drosophila persimilis]|uniref:GL15369 n=1 Tax=Drosophila persimilis TaxID=7234 RepID=B4IRK1_DROPE|nr:GL15369 [Drosophila persimilis]